jgi:hypothetical protein
MQPSQVRRSYQHGEGRMIRPFDNAVEAPASNGDVLDKCACSSGLGQECVESGGVFDYEGIAVQDYYCFLVNQRTNAQ